MQYSIFSRLNNIIIAGLLFVFIVLPFLFCIIIALIAHIRIIVNSELLIIQKYPLERKSRNIPLNEIISTEIIKVPSISEKRASWLQENKQYPKIYYINQRTGVMISLSNGGRLFIGSSRPQELNEILTKQGHNGG